ncbi:membrane protein YczE [Catellatospora vulcania]|uniref:membrane protein YczE n=1 Tax=Catellatospora vulcania TaxID=1460450 RepID=UPI0012D3D3F2|nr:hypothetical protein [Catellatospora vulcania]
MPLRERLPRRLFQLLIGLIGYGVSISLMLRAHLGNQPWDVLHQGVALRAGLSVGTVLIIVGAAVLLCWIPLRQRPGIGTIANIVVIGLVVDVANQLLPEPSHVLARWAFMIGGIVLCGFASGLYIGANLGPGPRDGLMTGLAARTWSLRGWRTLLEITVVAVGFALGGKAGLGTILYALAIGPLAQFFLPMLTVRSRTAAPAPAPAPASASTPASTPVATATEPASC